VKLANFVGGRRFIPSQNFGSSVRKSDQIVKPTKKGEAFVQKEAKIETSSPVALSDYDAITNTVQNYINGGKTGRTADMKLAFHPDATIFGYIGPDLFAGPIQGLFDWNDQNGAATELQGRITSIDLIETVASVRLELDNWTGHRFTDLFTLLKVDGEWKIMNKVFHLHAEN
jgi:hypothetical protein